MRKFIWEMVRVYSSNMLGQSIIQSPFNSKASLKLNNILYVPHIKKKLISVSELARDNDVYFEFHPSNCFVKSQATHQTLLEGTIDSEGLYTFDNFQL